MSLLLVNPQVFSSWVVILPGLGLVGAICKNLRSEPGFGVYGYLGWTCDREYARFAGWAAFDGVAMSE